MKICDPKVFEHLFKTYAKDLRRFIYFKTKDMDTAEDIVQETFIKLWDHCDGVDYTKVKSYLYKVATNIFLNKIKHEKVVREHQKLGSKGSTNESPEYLMIEQEFMKKIENAIASLPETQREVFLLNRMEKKKYREIAELLGVSVKAVEKRMHLALKIMNEKIGRV